MTKKTVSDIVKKIGIYSIPYFSFPFLIRPMTKPAIIELVVNIAIAKKTTKFGSRLTSDIWNGRSIRPGVSGTSIASTRP